MKGIRFGTCVRIAIAVMCMICLSGTMASADFLVAWRDSYKVVRYDDNWNIIGDFAVLSGLKPLGVVQDLSLIHISTETTRLTPWISLS